MNEEFKKSLNKFLEKETYIVAYRSNYDSARKFNNELIDYINNLQQENHQLKDRIEKSNRVYGKHEKDGTLWFVKSTNELKEILKGE